MAALAHATVPYELVARSADVGFVTPRDAADAAADRRRGRGRAAGRRPGRRDRARVRRPAWSSSTTTRPRRPRRLRRLDDVAGQRVLHSDARIFAGSAAQLADLLVEWATAGLTGFRLRPATLPHDLLQVTDAAGARAAAPRPASARDYEASHPARAARPAAPRQPLRHRDGLRGLTDDPQQARKQIHLAAHFPGVNNTTVWSDPAAGSHIEFASFVHLAQTAERGKFDFLFLAEGLRLREHKGRIHDLDVVGRPDTFTVLAALAAVTDRLGLTGTINSTFNEPYEVARQFATLDHLSGGRAAWNVVTSWDAFTGENFRRGGFLPQDQRYERARTFLATAQELFDSWRGDEVVADKATGVFLSDPDAGRFAHSDAHFDIAGHFNVPRSPQGRPVIFQAGDSDEGREFAASAADAIFTGHGTQEAGQAFYADVKGRLAKYGRRPDELLVLPAATFVLGDTDEEAAELARLVRLQQVSRRDRAAVARAGLESRPVGVRPRRTAARRRSGGGGADRRAGPGERPRVQGPARDRGAVAGAGRGREALDPRARHRGHRPADLRRQRRPRWPRRIDELVQSDASDGFILVPHITPAGLDPFVDTVVPLLQERGVFRTEYEGTTLRDHLGLAPLPAGPGR